MPSNFMKVVDLNVTLNVLFSRKEYIFHIENEYEKKTLQSFDFILFKGNDKIENFFGFETKPDRSFYISTIS